MLPAAALGLLGRGLFLADLPEGGALGVVLGNGGVSDQAGLEGVGQQPLHGRIGGPGLAGDQFDQGVPGRRALQRLARVGDVGEDEAIPIRFISSKASTPPPVSALARASNSIAAAGASSPTMAVARLRMTGNSFRWRR